LCCTGVGGCPLKDSTQAVGNCIVRSNGELVGFSTIIISFPLGVTNCNTYLVVEVVVSEDKVSGAITCNILINIYILTCD
jgi:hypothetical protein